MNIRHLEYFAAVIGRGSFSGAAEEMGVSQSALSQAIHSLEMKVGSQLFERSSGGARLTAAGHEFHAHVRDALESLNRATEAVARVNRMAGGSLDIACPGTLGIDPMTRLLSLFRSEFPKVRVRVHELPERVTGEQDLFDIGVDLVVTFEEMLVEGMHTVRLAPLELVAVLPRPAAATVTLREVLDKGLVTLPRNSASRTLLESQFDRTIIENSIAVEVVHPDAVFPLVLGGAGAAIVPAGHAERASSLSGLAVCTIHPRAILGVVAAMPRSSQSLAAHHFLRVCSESVAPS